MRTRLRVMSVIAACLVGSAAWAQQPVSRLKGHVTTASGQPIANAEVRAEAIYGSAAGTFAGQRTFSERTNAKGEWNIMGIAPGIWVFDVIAPGALPESVALPIRLLTASSPNAGGQLLTWQLVLKPVPPPPGEEGTTLGAALDAARAGHAEEVRTLLERVAENAGADTSRAPGASRCSRATRRWRARCSCARSSAIPRRTAPRSASPRPPCCSATSTTRRARSTPRAAARTTRTSRNS